MRPEDPSIDQNYFASLNQKEKLEHLVKFGILAPNSHNTQPWLFKIGESSVDIYINRDRELNYSDPTHRETYISIGAATENIIVASDYFGFKAEVFYIPDQTKPDLAVRISFVDSRPNSKSLIKNILTRHNNRFPFRDKKPPQEFLDKIQNLSGDIRVITDQSERDRVREVVENASESALDDQGFRDELSLWVKPSLNKYEDGMPGYVLGMPFILSLIFPKILRRQKLGKQQRKMDGDVLKESPVYVILTSERDQPEGWLDVGCLFETIALLSDREGLNIGAMGAPIEVKEYYKDLQQMLNINSRPQMFFRLGYATKVPRRAPRLTIEKVLIK